MYETVTMTVYVKRAPRKDLNPIMLFQNIEKNKAESMRPPPPPPPAGGVQQLPQGVTQISGHGGERKGIRTRAHGRSKSRDKKYHGHGDSSSGDSFDSDTGSDSSFTGSDSLGTSISSKSRGHRRYSHGRGGFRSHSRHREPRRGFFLEQSRVHSPEHHYDAYGGSPRPYVPDVPRVIPAVAALSPLDPVAAAYHAGKVDAEAERYGTADRVLARPIERMLEPRPVISYGRMEHRYSEPRYVDDRYIDIVRREDELWRRERDAEDYIDGRLDGRLDDRRPSDFLDRRHTDNFYERRQSEPIVWANRAPFSPTMVPRRYPPSSNNSGW
jgi:hypothetical protein